MISLTSVPGQVMEKIFLGGTKNHLKENAVIGHSQYGFMRAKSCLSNLIAFHEHVTHPADQRRPADAILVDFSKAFSAGSHSVTLDKMFSPQLGKHPWDG